MNIDEAINQAADHIEAYPGSYAFMQGMVVPPGFTPSGFDATRHGPGGFPMCMLARIGQMAGVTAGTPHSAVAREILGLDENEFYALITEATDRRFRDGARDNTATIPAAMRKVAKRYEGIPVEVREIFNPSWLYVVTTAPAPA